MQLRVARHTEHLDELVAFYRDAIGLREVGGFRGHDGYDGVFLDVPGSAAHLELTSGGEHSTPEAHPESLLVLYLGDDDAVQEVAARIGAAPVPPANPYWAAHALTFEDPDRFRVVLVPDRWHPEPNSHIEVDWYAGDREALRQLFELAEDSPERLEVALPRGRVLAASDGGRVVGYLQLVETEVPAHVELLSMAVADDRQRQGIGRALVERAVSDCRADGATTLLVATGAADTGNLRFYQRMGFRMLRIERDAFTPANGYGKEIMVEGVLLRDRVWLSLDL